MFSLNTVSQCAEEVLVVEIAAAVRCNIDVEFDEYEINGLCVDQTVISLEGQTRS
jgi:hypothetical protein